MDVANRNSALYIICGLYDRKSARQLKYVTHTRIIVAKFRGSNSFPILHILFRVAVIQMVDKNLPISNHNHSSNSRP